MIESYVADVAPRMDGALEALNREFMGLRTGRASVNLLDPIKVDFYGTMTPLAQIGTISAPEARLLTIQVWDRSMVKSVEKAIRESGLGLNPATDGQTIRIPIPSLNEERRNEMTKIASKYAEEARISIRNVRRDAMETLKKLEKEGTISEDEHHRLSDEVQKITDGRIKKIDDMLTAKQKDIMQV